MPTRLCEACSRTGSTRTPNRLPIVSGKIDNCQVGIYMGYATSREHALVDMRLYLPKEWTKDRKRRKKAGIPKEVRYRTRHQLCLEMLKKHGDKLPHTWITGDDEMGRPYWFRRRLNELTERYLLAIPSNTLVRDLHIDPPEYSGRGRRPKRPWTRVDRWTQSLDDKDWTAIEVRDGAKGPIIVEAVKRQVVGRANNTGQEGHEEVLVVIRYKDRDDRRVVKTDYHVSNGTFDTELADFVRAAKAEHRIEECIQRSKSEAVSRILRKQCGCDTPFRLAAECEKRLRRNEPARLYHWKQRNRLPPLNLNKRQI